MIEISLCIIAKDEEENLEVCLRSAMPHVDETIVVDTGSSDRTVDVADRLGARVALFTPETNPEAFFRDDEETCAKFGAPPPYSGDVMLGDFGAARRKSFSLARGKWIFWLDADDALEGGEGVRRAVADMEARNLDIGFVAYDYARDHLGRVFYRQWRERIVRADAASWVNPVHEVLMPSRPIATARYEGINVAHRRKADRKTVPNRNYKILLRQIAADRAAGAIPDPRTLFYLGQEARWVEPLKACGFYEEYLARSGWPEERAAAHVALGSMMEFGQLGGDPAECYARAERDFAVAAAEMPSNPDGLFGMARLACLRGRWADCVAYTERAVAIGNTDSMLGANPMDRLYRPHVFLNYALANLGRLEEALASCRAGLQACEDDPGVPGGAPGMLKYNIAYYEVELRRRAEAAAAKPAPQPEQPREVAAFDKNEDVDRAPVEGIPRDALVIWAMQLWKQVAHVDCDWARAYALLKEMPASVKQDPVWVKMINATAQRLPRSYALGTPVMAVNTGISFELGVTGVSAEIKKTADRIVEFSRPRTIEGGGWTGIPGPLVDPRFNAWKDRTWSGDENVEKPLSIVFWTGPAPEPWTPRTPNEKGLGGSETACIEMAKHLAALGHEVTVYGDPPVNRSRHDGVLYLRHQAFTGTQVDVFISSRAPWAIEQFGDVKAKVKLLWVHDIHCGSNSPDMERWLLKFDRVLCLSNWHKEFFLSQYPTLHSDRVIVTRNGIDPARFWNLPPKKTNSLVWSSSPNRGLDMLLHNFEFIRRRVSDAELHVYYGFDTWEQIARARGLQNELNVITHFKSLLPPIGGNRDGVYNHGKCPQIELAEAFMRAKVWPYLTGFTETSCISAMEAMAAGCVPVASRVAALAETVKHGVLLDNADPATPGRFVEEVIRCLIDESYREPMARAGRQWALKNLSWESLAVDWNVMFHTIVEDLRVDPLPKWKDIK